MCGLACAKESQWLPSRSAVENARAPCRQISSMIFAPPALTCALYCSSRSSTKTHGVWVAGASSAEARGQCARTPSGTRCRHGTRSSAGCCPSLSGMSPAGSKPKTSRSHRRRGRGLGVVHGHGEPARCAAGSCGSWSRRSIQRPNHFGVVRTHAVPPLVGAAFGDRRFDAHERAAVARGRTTRRSARRRRSSARRDVRRVPTRVMRASFESFARFAVVHLDDAAADAGLHAHPRHAVESKKLIGPWIHQQSISSVKTAKAVAGSTATSTDGGHCVRGSHRLVLPDGCRASTCRLNDCSCSFQCAWI